MPKKTTGVITAVMLTARRILPVAMFSQLSGFANANTSEVGASSLKIGATSIHFSPSKTWMISSANRGQVIAMGTVTESSIE